MVFHVRSTGSLLQLVSTKAGHEFDQCEVVTLKKVLFPLPEMHIFRAKHTAAASNFYTSTDVEAPVPIVIMRIGNASVR